MNENNQYPPRPFFFIYDTMTKNGKTIKENNQAIKHNIPIGSLVEVKYARWYGEGASQRVEARLWVVGHVRDCDGTPLYNLSRYRDPQSARDMYPTNSGAIVTGFMEHSLKVVPITPETLKGDDALEWPEDEE